MERNYFYKSHHELILSPSEEEVNPYLQTQSPYWHRLNRRAPTELIQSFGPTNISLPFPLHLSLLLQEKYVTTAKVEIGWLHQGIEKAFESVPWKIAPSFATRVNPVVPAPIALGFILSLEKLWQIDEKIPKLAQSYRLLMLECARIFHHLRTIHQTIAMIAPYALVQASAHAVGLAQSLQTFINYDETSQPRWEIGGVTSPIYQTWTQQLQKNVNAASKAVHLLKRGLSEESQIEKRLTAIGVMTKENAVSFGLTGPCLRASGVDDDLRRSHPYFNYFSYTPTVFTEKNGDAWARFKIRLKETESSLSIIQKIIHDMLKEINRAESITIPSALSVNCEEASMLGMQTSHIESPEGELAITIVSNGKHVPYRVRMRTPSFFHTAALSAFLQNADIDDVALIIYSLGITGLEVDR